MSKQPHCSKTRRLRVGRLADGREAFAIAGYCISALGDYRFVAIWVRNRQAYGGFSFYRDYTYAAPGSRKYKEAFALIVKGKDYRVSYALPLRISCRLGWWKPEKSAAHT
jgi:hypothetical protein